MFEDRKETKVVRTQVTQEGNVNVCVLKKIAVCRLENALERKKYGG